MGRVAIVAYVLVLGGCAAAAPETVLLNGKIFTSNPAQPWAEALAIRGDRVIAVGDTATIGPKAGPSTRTLDLGGRTVVPGFNDAHAHVGPHLPLVRLTVGDDPMTTDIAAALVEALTRAGPGQLIQGSFGGRLWEDATVTRTWLDQRAPANPVRLSAFTGHGVILNSAALTLAGITETTGDPEGGRFLRDPSGRLNGRGEEYADFLVARHLAQKVDAASVVQAYRAFAEEAAQFGITTIQLMGDALPMRTIMSSLVDAGTPLRWHAYRFPIRETGSATFDSRPHLPPQPTTLLDARGMKFILDGTPVERLAFMRAPYADAPGELGRLNVSGERLREFVGWGYATEDPILMHAVGDGAIEAYVSAMEQAGLAEVWRQKRPRIEHGDFLMPDQRERVKALGVVVVQNPVHFLLRDILVDRVGPERAAVMQPMRSLLEAGIPLALGSDGQVNPFLNILWASTHPGNAGEAITREQAVTAYTRGSAYAELADKDKGHLSVGALADLAVLTADVFTAPPGSMEGIRSVLTIVGGRVAYDAGVVR